MPHMFVNRPRNYFKDSPSVTHGELMIEYFWESVNAISYVLGGHLKIVGAVLFLPAFKQFKDIGSWASVVGSILYLVVSVHDITEVFHHGSATSYGIIDITASFCYAIGAVLFIFGSIFFLPGIEMMKAGAWSFIIGSILFMVGAMANSVQIFKSPTQTTAFYANLVAVQFMVGSAFFLSASVPYTFDLETDNDINDIYRFAAILYICGSILFTVAGFCNYCRAALIITLQEAKLTGSLTPERRAFGKSAETSSEVSTCETTYGSAD